MKTPQQSYPKLAKAIGVPELYFKREDEHKYGSHKGRSIPVMIKEYSKEGHKSFVISSSGNAALAAMLYAEKHNQNNPNNQVSLEVFVGKKIPEAKLAKLTEHTSTAVAVTQVERPKQEAFKQDKDGVAKMLRQSTDDLALEGYFDLARELTKLPELQAIFVPTSSGTTALALAQACASLSQQPQIHIVQTTACCPIAEEFDAADTRTDTSLAGAIVDKVAHRKDAAVAAVRNTDGAGWIVTDEEIQAAIDLTKEKTKLTISPNSALAVAGLMKAVAAGQTWDGPVACLITGD